MIEQCIVYSFLESSKFSFLKLINEYVDAKSFLEYATKYRVTRQHFALFHVTDGPYRTFV